jgi:ribonuclease P protein component
VQRLLKRRDFLKAQKGRRHSTGLFSLQAIAREPGPDDAPRVGFTVSKANGNAVKRNRIRRKLKEAVRLQAASLPARDAHDYVLVARPAALRASFQAISADVTAAFRGIARPKQSTRLAAGGQN